MDQKCRKILMACCNYWDSPFQVGSHHLARGFAEAGWSVGFISDPISPLHWLGGGSSELNERYSIYRSGGRGQLDERIWTYVPGALLTPHNKFLLNTLMVQKGWYKLTYPSVSAKIHEAGFEEVDLLYFDSISQAFLLTEIKHKCSIFRIADKNSGFEKYTKSTEAMEKWLAQNVDLVVYTANELEEYVHSLNPKKSMYFPNGVNYNHFAHGDHCLPEEYMKIPKPIAVYVGAMDIWFDYELINQAAKALPGVSFVLIGPKHLAEEKIESLPNIYLLGRRPYSQIPPYLFNANVGIIPFNVKDYPMLVNSINPLKLYEYMACGLPVTAVEWDELKNLNSPAVLTKTYEEFIEAVQSAIVLGERSNVYMGYAAQNDWSRRILQLQNFAIELTKEE